MQEIEIEERSDIAINARPAHALAIHEGIGKMVIARKSEQAGGDDVLEQLNILPGWIAVKERVIPLANGGVESICFVGENIVCTHMNGSVSLANPHNEFVKRVQICASPIWACCSIDSKTAAFVTHSSTLYIFDVEERLIKSSVNLGVDTRLFSVAAMGDKIAIGATDTTFIVQNNEIKHTLSVARKERRLPSIVWSVVFLSDRVMASGDSSGTVSFWNVNGGSLIKAVTSHQADILTMTVTNNILWAAGVDPRIIGFREVSANNFQIIQKRNGPIRDVKALSGYDGKVFAVGDDHDIFVGKDNCAPIKQQWNKCLRLGGHLAAVAASNFVDIYPDDDICLSASNGNHVKHSAPAARIFTPKKLPLLAFDLSNDGTHLALSTSESTTLYRLFQNDKNPIIRLPTEAKSASALKLLSDGLILCTGDFEIWSAPLNGDEPIQLFEQAGSGMVSQLAVTPNGVHAAVITTRCQVFAIDLKKGESRAVRADLPIDVTLTDAEALFILTASEGFELPPAEKKLLFEFPATGGSAKHSAALQTLYDLDGSTHSRKVDFRPVSLCPGPNDRILVLSANGKWILINKNRTEVLTSESSHSSPVSVMFRNEKRIFSCRIEPPKPVTAPFHLKKFGHQ